MMPKVMSARNGPDRKQQLLSAAYVIIAEFGLEGATLKKIAGHAGLGAASVNFYFKTKEDLLNQVITDLSGEFESALLSSHQIHAKDPIAGLSAIFEVMLDTGSLEGTDKIRTWCAYYDARNNNQNVRAILAHSENLVHGLISEYCEEILTQEAASSSSVHRASMIHGIYSVIDSFWTDIAIHEDNADIEYYRYIYQGFLSNVMPWAFNAPKEYVSDKASQAGNCRIASASDLPELEDFVKVVRPDHPDPEKLVSLIKASMSVDNIVILICKDPSGSLSGMAQLHVQHDFETADARISIQNLVCTKSAGGVAMLQLLQEAKQYAAGSGAACLEIVANQPNIELREAANASGLSRENKWSVMRMYLM